MSTTIYAHKDDPAMNIPLGVPTLGIPASIVFTYSPGGMLTAVNTTHTVQINGPNLVTLLLLNAALASEISSFVNSTYGLSTSAADVFLI